MKGGIDLMGDLTLIDYIILTKSTVIVKLQSHDATYRLQTVKLSSLIKLVVLVKLAFAMHAYGLKKYLKFFCHNEQRCRGTN